MVVWKDSMKKKIILTVFNAKLVIVEDVTLKEYVSNVLIKTLSLHIVINQETSVFY